MEVYDNWYNDFLVRINNVNKIFLKLIDISATYTEKLLDNILYNSSQNKIDFIR